MTTFLGLVEWGGHSAGRRFMNLPVSELWVHHSVTNEDLGAPGTADAIADLRELDGIGLARGHGGISYSYAIHPSGVVGEGQGIRVGAHTAAGRGALDRNPWSFGVVFIGNFNEDEPTPEAIQAFRDLRSKLIADGHLVTGVYPTGGHRDAPGQSTACPGDHIEAILDVLRADISPPPEPTEEVDVVLLHNTGFHLVLPSGQIVRYFGEGDPAMGPYMKFPVVDVDDAELAQAYLIDQSLGKGTAATGTLDADELARKIGGAVGAELGRRLAS